MPANELPLGQPLRVVIVSLGWALAAVGAFSAIRALANPSNQTPAATGALLIATTAMIVIGLALFSRASSMRVGLIVMATATIPLAWATGLALWSISYTGAQTIMRTLLLFDQARTQNAIYLVTAPGVLIAVFFAIAAVLVTRDQKRLLPLIHDAV